MSESQMSQKIQCKSVFLYQYVATISACLILMCGGMHIGWTSPSLPILLDKNSESPLTPAEGSWITVAVVIGPPFGSIIAVMLADRIGRKCSLLLISPIFLITWLVIAYAHSVWVLICVRFSAGIATGLAQSLLPMYVGEIANKSSRGLFTSSILIANKLGTLIINIIGIHCSIKTTALISCAFPALHFITFLFMPESPRFYVLKGDKEKAAASLQKLTKSQNVSKEISELASAIKTEVTSSGTFVDVFKDKVSRKALGIILGLFLVEHFGGYLPITFYCLTIFNESGGAIQGSTATIIMFTVQVAIATVSSFFMDSIGRRPMLIVSTVCSGFALVTGGAYFYIKNQTNIDISSLSFLPLVALLLCIISFNIGLTIIPVLIMSEIFQINMKASAICIANIFCNLIGAAVTKFFQFTKDEFGIHVPFLVFASSCALGLVFVIYCVPETKGKTLEEIQIFLRGNKHEENKLNVEATESFLVEYVSHK